MAPAPSRDRSVISGTLPGWTLFVGGPWHGRLHYLPDNRSDWRVAVARPVATYYGGEPPTPWESDVDEYRYHRRKLKTGGFWINDHRGDGQGTKWGQPEWLAEVMLWDDEPDFTRRDDMVMWSAFDALMRATGYGQEFKVR